MIIYTFTHPGDDDIDADGGGTSVCERSQLSDVELREYSTEVCKVSEQHNEIVTNSNSKLEFDSFTRAAFIFPCSSYITFNARRKGDGQIGTYQAAVLNDYDANQVHLVLLRHVEDDKILATLSFSGVDEELKKTFVGNWGF